MTPNFLTETRAFIETEVAYWQAQAKDIGQKSVAQAEAIAKESRDRYQAAAEAQSTLAATYFKHGMETFERGVKLCAQAFTIPA